MANKKISELPSGSSFMGSSAQEGVEAGINVKFTPDQTNPFRGNWSTTNALPSTGGRYTSGVPAAGDEYHLVNGLSIGSNDYPPGTIAKSLVNGPASINDWVFYSMQAIF